MGKSLLDSGKGEPWLHDRGKDDSSGLNSTAVSVVHVPTLGLPGLPEDRK